MFEDSLDVLEKFLNCCKSAKNKIYIWPKVYEKDSIENYDVIDFYIGNGEQIIKELSGLVK